MPLPTPVKATDKWKTGVTNAGTSWLAGMDAITDNPMTKAADKKDVWLARIQAAAEKWERNLRAVNFTQWKSQIKAMGSANYTAGVKKGEPKYLAFATKFFPYLESGIRTIQGMPNSTLQERINRAITMMQYLAQYKGQ